MSLLEKLTVFFQQEDKVASYTYKELCGLFPDDTHEELIDCLKTLFAQHIIGEITIPSADGHHICLFYGKTIGAADGEKPTEAQHQIVD